MSSYACSCGVHREIRGPAVAACSCGREARIVANGDLGYTVTMGTPENQKPTFVVAGGELKRLGGNDAER